MAAHIYIQTDIQTDTNTHTDRHKYTHSIGHILAFVTCLGNTYVHMRKHIISTSAA